MTELHLASDFSIPAEAVTQTFAILAKRGVGKIYCASVLVEELLKAGLHAVVVDPVGVWWGLRAAMDGTRPGLPIVILGGDHGDVPLTVAAGQVIADLVVDEGISAVLDLAHFRKGEQVRFMTDFAERLYHRNRRPLQLVLDEADAWAPQRPLKGQERMLGAVEDLVRRGRARGIGVTLVTQRSAVLNKDVLTQAEVLVALRTIAPQDGVSSSAPRRFAARRLLLPYGAHTGHANPGFRGTLLHFRRSNGFDLRGDARQTTQPIADINRPRA